MMRQENKKIRPDVAFLLANPVIINETVILMMIIHITVVVICLISLSLLFFVVTISISIIKSTIRNSICRIISVYC